jgi:hypothetical protein
MNARGRHVPLSIRVADEFRTNAIDVSRFGLVDRVRVQMNDRFGTPRASGWQPDFVGICARGTTVTLQRVTNPGHTVRVCTGVNACDPGVWDPIAKGSPRLYSGFLVDTPPGESISFRCPEGAAPYGNPERSYFSILVDLGPGASPLVDPVLVRPPSPTTIYPAPERDVFTYLEGAFYGQLLPSSDDWFDMNTCSSPLWASGPAYEQGRICSFSGMVAGCHGIHRGPCAVACPRGGLGAVDAYHDCQSDADVLPWLTVTVFLNEPSAIVSDPAASATVPLHGVCTTGTRLDSGRGSVVTNVCAADSFCCNTAWDSTCVGEVESVAGSLECVCSHDVCTTGTALSSMCGPVAKSVCDADGYCCNTAWDSTCVAEVESVASSQECVLPP